MLRQARGMSLIELLIALALSGIMSSLAVFYIPDWINRLQAESAINGFRSVINTARHAAITFNVDVIVCPRDGEVCGPRNTWHRGTLVFADHDADQQVSAGDTMVAHLPALKSGQVVWRSFRNRSYLKFTATGLTDWQNGHLLYCPDNGDPQFARQVVLNHAGRTYSSRDSDGDGIHEDVRGNALVCS